MSHKKSKRERQIKRRLCDSPEEFTMSLKQDPLIAGIQESNKLCADLQRKFVDRINNEQRVD